MNPKPMSPPLIEHLERRLGLIQGGSNVDLRGNEMPFQVAEFRGGGQLEGSTSFATIGLSNHYLKDPDSDDRLLMELIMTTHAAHAPARIPQSLMLIAGKMLKDHLAVLKGEAIPLPGPIAENSELNNLYATYPGYFDEEFDAFDLDEKRAAAIVWLVPISASEEAFIDDHGWRKFDKKITIVDPDLLDLYRKPIC